MYIGYVQAARLRGFSRRIDSESLSANSLGEVDNIRVCKILGSGFLKLKVVSRIVFKRETKGTTNNAEITMCSCAVDIMQTENKGTVLIKTAEELKNFSKGEVNLIE